MRHAGACAAFALAAALLVASPSAGPDLGFYLDWASAVLAADPAQLHGRVLSPSGVPLSQWSIGPGLLFALGDLALGRLASVRDAGLAVGSVSALVLWWAMVTLLSRASGDRPWLVVLGLGAAFVGTHAGFYSHAHGSESLAYGAGALMLVLLTTSAWRSLDGFHVGVAAALLVLLRPQLALYALPALLLAAARTWRAADRTASRYVRLAALAATAAPMAVALLVSAVVNRWMTGSFWRSPYAFSGAGFRSLDWARPELAAVLTHPYHGLLVYHPLYGLGFAALAACVVRARDVQERALWVAGLAAVLAHLYLQASWYVWWMGTLSFGMRGLALAALVVMPALVRAMSLCTRPLARGLWQAGILACCCWSTVLLLQKHGPLRSWPALLAAQGRALGAVMQPEVAGCLLAGLVLAAALAWAWHLRPADAGGVLASTTLVPSGLALGYLLVRASGRWLHRGSTEELRVVVFAAVLAAAVLVPVVAVARWRGLRLRDAASEGLAWSATVTLLAAGAAFLPLARETEHRIAAGTKPVRATAYVASVELDQAREAYYEYLELPGFAEKKAALLAFLEANGVEP